MQDLAGGKNLDEGIITASDNDVGAVICKGDSIDVVLVCLHPQCCLQSMSC